MRAPSVEVLLYSTRWEEEDQEDRTRGWSFGGKRWVYCVAGRWVSYLNQAAQGFVSKPHLRCRNALGLEKGEERSRCWCPLPQ